ncbi:MAG TPA: baseplate J/gp47 family protein [Bryobacteraceae bacterium]|nr:baseplate J/gp47 family protein [Bryobacteraceae bacterium]
MPYESISAIEIDRKLRDDFRRRLRDYGVNAETTDPVLAVLFRTFAQQLETLYAETGRIRLALLDELIAGLGIEKRMARPAQTVTRFLATSAPQFIEAGTELIGEAESGERLTFTTDAAVLASRARIAVGATYQDGALRVMPGIELPEAFQAMRPALDPVRVNLGPNPALYLAIENLPPSHLSQHGFFFELSPDAYFLRQALQNEPWCIFGNDGDLGSAGILRPKTGNAGTMNLTFLVDGAAGEAAQTPLPAEQEVPNLPAGFYHSRLFLMPVIPPERRFFCRIPRGMEAALNKIFGRDAGRLFSEPRAWIRISFPKSSPSLHDGISAILLHAMTASNVECSNQTVYFDQQGTSIPISREAGTKTFLVAPLSVFGEMHTAYLPEFEPASRQDVGRFAVRNGRIELRPARRPDGSNEAYVNVRAWVTAGSLGNSVGPGRVESLLKRGTINDVRITNPTSAAGGTNSEDYEQAQTRFAEALLSRGRIVTQADLETMARSFDRRVVRAEVTSRLKRTEKGLQRFQQVTCRLDRDGFVDPDAEIGVLRNELDRFLRKRFLYDTELQLELEWN